MQRQDRSSRARGWPRAASRKPCNKASGVVGVEGVEEVGDDVGGVDEVLAVEPLQLWLLAFTACMTA